MHRIGNVAVSSPGRAVIQQPDLLLSDGLLDKHVQDSLVARTRSRPLRERQARRLRSYPRLSKTVADCLPTPLALNVAGASVRGVCRSGLVLSKRAILEAIVALAITQK